MASCFRHGLVVLAVVLYSLQVTAAPVVRPASTTDVFKKGGQTLDINRHWGEILDVKPTPSTSAKVNIPVRLTESFGWARVGQWVKNGIKAHPGKIAATAGVMWLIDQIPGASFDPVTGLPMSPAKPGAPLTGVASSSDIGWAVAGSSHKRYTARAACEATYPVGTWLMHQTANPPTQMQVASYIISGTGDTSVTCHLMASNAAYGPIRSDTVLRSGTSCPTGSVYSSTDRACSTQTPAMPMTDAELDGLVSNVPNMPEHLWDSGLGPDLASIPGTFDGPDSVGFSGPSSIDLPATRTTSTDSVSGNTTVVESLPSIRFDYGTNPLSITPSTSTTTNTYTNGQLQSSTTTNTQTNTNNSTVVTTPAPEVPTDCAFMPTVCAFIDWVKQPFTEQAPDFSDLIDDEEFSESITISGNATCPAPTMIDTNLGSFEFSWQPACTWAGMIKPLVIIAALIAAIYISLGVARSE
ncbi:virulence factor TspB C-terminal domain-related protein [Stutzerimonas stutzeri]|uniref:virulence factor TspB C-terminal domain-related protein n=1 Tax=Stutzerimonas stutzeri TaxID=316 RepID=UPI001480C755|nr:virulence factor TspB C-terminal domain-related protein [Stutzerimonas stutzeri]WRQ05060.1 virulence factor TspB C-terminal domain-related protein [Stutzerimonas stutzeri]WRQ05069.1 virulence factor TspB C-terminal domain-related protein [Stutzerimonas stutzeri]